MDVLLDHSLEDFLLFSPDVYWRLFELHNARFALVAPFCVAAAAFLMAIPFLGSRALRIAFLVAAGAASLTGWAYFVESYSDINWAAPWGAWMFLAMSLALAGSAFGGDAAPVNGRSRWIAIGLLVLGGVVYPLQGVALGRPIEGAQIFGLAPDPTAIMVLGLAGLTTRSLLRVVAALLASVWCLLGGLTLWAMGSGEAWVLFGAAATAFLVLVRPSSSGKS
jgi:hypothetical protein